MIEQELEKIKEKGGNGFIAENPAYGKKIHLLRCPICFKDNDYAVISSGKCAWCDFDSNLSNQLESKK
jgi:hypothetical protein